jgi:CheY-like chemotaxis protein/HPt (histidine-containing phosphotransfer) domain-containing protein
MNNPFNENVDKSFRVLVVDDTDLIQRALKSYLQDFDIEVITCSNGLEGIQIAVEAKPRLIFLDLMMPELDGIKMLQVKQVLQEIKDIPVVIISANTSKQNVLAAMELGVVKVISKPLKRDVIVNAVKEIFQKEWKSLLIRDGSYQSDHQQFSVKAREEAASELKEQLIGVFIKNFKNQKKQIIESLESKDRSKFKAVIHDIKGAGGTIGCQNISDLAGEIYEKELNSDWDWYSIQVKCDKLSLAVKQIEELFSGDD